MTRKPRSRYAFSSRTKSGNSSRHGTHQVAQKFTRTTWPFCFAMAAESSLPSSSPFSSVASAARPETASVKSKRAAAAALG